MELSGGIKHNTGAKKAQDDEEKLVARFVDLLRIRKAANEELPVQYYIRFHGNYHRFWIKYSCSSHYNRHEAVLRVFDSFRRVFCETHLFHVYLPYNNKRFTRVPATATSLVSIP